MKKVVVFIALLVFGCNQNKNLENNLEISDSVYVKSNSVSKVTDDKVESTFVKSDLLIIPGKSIGGTALLDASSTLEKFGEPSFSDAAMGKAWSVWTGKGLDAVGNKATLAVYVTYNGNDMSKQVVKRIRVTSSDFQTAEGVHTGLTLKEIEKIYPNLELDYKMSNLEFVKETKFYILKGAGISFEFDTINDVRICTAIAIASVEDISNQPYLLLDSAEINAN